MNQNDFVCSVDLRDCGRGCESNHHNCPCLVRKVTVDHGSKTVYLGNGKAPVRTSTRPERNDNRDKE